MLNAIFFDYPIIDKEGRYGKYKAFVYDFQAILCIFTYATGWAAGAGKWFLDMETAVAAGFVCQTLWVVIYNKLVTVHLVIPAGL